MLNSEKSSSSHLNLYYFLGVLMGVCIRTGAKMILDLPKVVWKQLVGQKINIDDLAEVEIRFVRMLQMGLEFDEEAYQSTPFNWVSEMPDGTSLDLREDGEAQKPAEVSFADRFMFIERALRTRLVQS